MNILVQSVNIVAIPEHGRINIAFLFSCNFRIWLDAPP
jgi:hypothetical protein